MIHILISIRRPFSGLILSGEKPWELRKNAPRIPRGEHVTLWTYESGKDGERAACRAWVPMAQRECRSCRYYDKIRSFDICTACTPGAYLVKSCNWEPRKEGE